MMLAVAAKPNDYLERLGKRLRTLREQYSKKSGRKFYQRDAAKLVGINEGTYRNYEYGKARLPEPAAKILAAEWGIEWRALYEVPTEETTATIPPGSDISGFKTLNPAAAVSIPYIGGVGANEKANWVSPLDAPDSIEVPSHMALFDKGQPLRFACTVIGDSCYDLLWPGDTAVFHRTDVPRIGQIVLYLHHDNLLTIKQLKHNGREFILHPLNPAYDDVPANGRVLGYLVGIVRHVGSRKMTISDDHGITP